MNLSPIEFLFELMKSVIADVAAGTQLRSCLALGGNGAGLTRGEL